MKILLVAEARPNFMKIAPLIHELNTLTGRDAGKQSELEACTYRPEL